MVSPRIKLDWNCVSKSTCDLLPSLFRKSGPGVKKEVWTFMSSLKRKNIEASFCTTLKINCGEKGWCTFYFVQKIWKFIEPPGPSKLSGIINLREFFTPLYLVSNTLSMHHYPLKTNQRLIKLNVFMSNVTKNVKRVSSVKTFQGTN